MATNNAINSNIPIEVSKGGTGKTSLTDHGVLVGSGTAGIDALAVGSTGQLLTGVTGADPVFSSTSTGNFTFTKAVAGSTEDFTLSQTDNTNAASNALLRIQTGGASGGDPFILFGVSGVTEWTFGVDNSDSDRLKISRTGTLGSLDTMSLTTGGDIDFPTTSSGITKTVQVINSDNTAAANSAALLLVTTQPATVGDPMVRFNIAGTSTWTMGADNSVANDPFKISRGNTLGTSDALIINNTGEINYPLQPAFLAVGTVTATDVTGDGTTYSLANFNTEIFDQNNDFAANTFTAPVTGRYLLNCSIMFSGLTASHTNGLISIITSNRTYASYINNFANLRTSSDQAATTFTAIVDMDAADTATIEVVISGGTKVVDIIFNGTADPRTWFSGYLLC